MSDDHNCMANLSPNENDIVIEPGEKTYVYRDCEICGDEITIEYTHNDMWKES